MEKFDTDLSTLHPILTECRVIKSDLELAVIQYANDISSEAHIEVQYSYQLLYFHMSSWPNHGYSIPDLLLFIAQLARLHWLKFSGVS